MEKSENISTLAAAIVAFQGELTPVAMDKKVKVSLKSGGGYTFDYASFQAIKHVCQPLLKKHSLAIVQLIGGGTLTTILLHASGEYISSTLNLPIKENMTLQEIGSVVTYMKRYSYSAILNIVSDEDDDGNIADKNSVSDINKPSKGAIIAKLEMCKTLADVSALWKEVRDIDKISLHEDFKNKQLDIKNETIR